MVVKKKQIDGTEADAGFKLRILSAFLYNNQRKCVRSGAIERISPASLGLFSIAGV